jgi:hypothetical protein
MLESILKRLCKNMIDQEVKKQVSIKVNSFKKDKEVFNIGDEIYFYYQGQRDGTYMGYYQGRIREIKEYKNSQGCSKVYEIDTEKYPVKFIYDFTINDDQMSHCKFRLRNKLLSKDTFIPIQDTSYKKLMKD